MNPFIRYKTLTIETVCDIKHYAMLPNHCIKSHPATFGAIFG